MRDASPAHGWGTHTAQLAAPTEPHQAAPPANHSNTQPTHPHRTAQHPRPYPPRPTQHNTAHDCHESAPAQSSTPVVAVPASNKACNNKPPAPSDHCLPQTDESSSTATAHKPPAKSDGQSSPSSHESSRRIDPPTPVQPQLAAEYGRQHKSAPHETAHQTAQYWQPQPHSATTACTYQKPQSP